MDENGSVAYTVLLLVDGSRDVQIYFCDYISLMNEENELKLFQRKENKIYETNIH